MIKLIKLEYKKHKIGKYIKIALIITVALTLFSFAQTYLGIARDADTGMIDAVENTVSSYVDLFSTIAFLVLSCAMHAAFIVDEYKNKTMDLMFQYPIERRKIMISKMLAVLFFNFAATVLCKLVIYAVIYIGSFSFTPDFLLDGINFLSITFYTRIVLQSFAVILLSLLALYIGLLFKSTVGTIIMSFLLILLSQGSIGDLTLTNSLFSQMILIALSIFSGFLCVAKIETKDVDGGK